MSNVFLNIIIGISAVAVGVLAFADEFGKKKPFKFIKSLRFKICVFILATFFGILASVKKDSKAEQQSADEKAQAQIEKSKNDSLNKIFTLKSNKEIATTITDALGKYHLKYDSSQKAVIRVVRDSLKSVIRESELPTLIMMGDGKDGIQLSGNNKEILITFLSQDATSRNVTLEISYLDSDDSLSFHYSGHQIYLKSYTLVKGKYGTKSIFFDSLPKFFVMWCRGTYTNNDGMKKLTYNEVTLYNTTSKKLWYLTNESKDRILNTVKKFEN